MLYSHTIKLVRFYNGADGLKTGYTKSAGYCLTATAKRNNMRLITVIMNSDTSDNRNSDSMKMLDYGFNQYDVEVLIKKNTIIGSRKLSKAKQKVIKFTPKYDVTVLYKKGNRKNNSNYKLDIGNINLPIKKGDKVGVLKLKEEGELAREIDVVSNSNIDKISFIDLFKRNLGIILFGDKS